MAALLGQVAHNVVGVHGGENSRSPVARHRPHLDPHDSAERLSVGRQEPLAEGANDGRMLVWKTGPHSHNEFLQTWYELGAVGAILLLATGCAVILSIGRLSPAIQPFMLAQFAGFFVMAAFSWGMWQSWLMALPGLAVLYAALAASFATAAQPDYRQIFPRRALAAGLGEHAA